MKQFSYSGTSCICVINADSASVAADIFLRRYPAHLSEYATTREALIAAFAEVSSDEGFAVDYAGYDGGFV